MLQKIKRKKVIERCEANLGYSLAKSGLGAQSANKIDERSFTESSRRSFFTRKTRTRLIASIINVLEHLDEDEVGREVKGAIRRQKELFTSIGNAQRLIQMIKKEFIFRKPSGLAFSKGD